MFLFPINLDFVTHYFTAASETDSGAGCFSCPKPHTPLSKLPEYHPIVTPDIQKDVWHECGWYSGNVENLATVGGTLVMTMGGILVTLV